MAALITLLTDFGCSDPFVGIMKGVILSRDPDARIVDLTHELPPQDVKTGAFQLLVSVPYFPADTIFVCVVDPGVGSDRRILWAKNKAHQFLAPDNGLLSWVGSIRPFDEVREVTNKKLFNKRVSNTFHGRDIFAPVAAELSRGLDPAKLGPKVTMKPGMPFPRLKHANGTIRGSVLAIDRFGNAVTTLMENDLKKTAAIRFKDTKLGKLKSHYSSVDSGSPLAVVGSFGFVELAVRDGNFAKRFNVKIGDLVDAGT